MKGNKYLNCAFNIKAEDITDQGMFTGFGSTFGGEPDDYGDVVMKGAFQKTISNGGRNKNYNIPILWQHNSGDVLGKWMELRETEKGLEVTGQLNLKLQKAQEAQELLKMGVLSLSIGYDVMRDEEGNVLKEAIEYSKDRKIRYLKDLSLFEISLVTFPANIRATITSVKDVEDIEQKANGNIREFERLLRDEGLSNQLSKIIASNWNKNKSDTNFTSELLKAVKEIRKTL